MYANKRLMLGMVTAFFTMLGEAYGATCTDILAADRAVVHEICKRDSSFPDNYSTMELLIRCGNQHASLTVQCATELAGRMAKVDSLKGSGLNESGMRIINKIRQHSADAFVDLLGRCDFSRRTKLFSDEACRQVIALIDRFVGDSAGGIASEAERVVRVLNDMLDCGRSREITDHVRSVKQRIESVMSPEPAGLEVDTTVEEDTAPVDLTPRKTAFLAKQRRKEMEELLQKMQGFVEEARRAKDVMPLVISGKFSGAADCFAKVGLDQPDLADACVAGLEELDTLARSPRFSTRIAHLMDLVRDARGKDSASCYSVRSADSTSIASDACSVRSED